MCVYEAIQIRRIKEINEPYKLEILDSIKDDTITIYHIGDEWWDLCSGPHVETTGREILFVLSIYIYFFFMRETLAGIQAIRLRENQ